MENIKITQKDIAVKLGVTQGAVSDWFRGACKPTLNNAYLLKQHFGIPVDIWVNNQSFISYMSSNSQRFGAIKRLRRQTP